MSENDVFVKRVEINNNSNNNNNKNKNNNNNNNNNSNNNNNNNNNNVSSPVKEKLNLLNKSDVEKSNELKKPQSCTVRFNSFLVKFKIKAALSHVGLLLSLGLYCFFGGFVFRELELPNVKENEAIQRSSILIERERFLKSVTSNVGNLTMDNLSMRLKEYEVTAMAVVDGGLQLSFDDNFPAKSEKWSLMQGIFFSSTVCTTIGYGNIVPETFNGRLFCIVFALIGIPFTLTVIADYGKIMANTVSTIAKKCVCKKESKFKKFKGRKWLYAFSAVGFLGLYLACGASILMNWEHWSFFDSFYFCFVTMTTIGFGDLVPGEYYMLICTLYILIGLAMTSTIIELVRRQYVQSWQKLQQLRLGSFADHLRRLGESHGGDVNTFQNDLRSLLTVVSMPKRGQKDGAGKKGDNEMEAIMEAILQEVKIKQMEKPRQIQIIIYESSV
ncbi:unnamed protein product [Diamesa serratosioi]